MPAQDDGTPAIRKAGPPPRSGREPVAKAKGPVDPPDAPELLASTEPDDDLSDYIQPPDPEPLPADMELNASADLQDSAVSRNKLVASEVTTATLAAAPSSGPVSSADTELVLRLERELAEARARVSGENLDVSKWAAGPPPADPVPGQRVLIHVREDGFTANGRVWYRGQELEFTVGAPNWAATVDRWGKSWLLMDDAEQLRRYGQIMFGHGPWPGDPFDNVRAADAERQRGREAPTIPVLSSQNQPRT